nr:MAG TPA: hypothetical protein [Caudoviricetes sp.]
MVDFGGRRSGFEDDDNYYGRQDILRESPITLESKKQAQQKTPSFGLGELLAGLAGLGKGITDSAINVGKSTIGAIGTGITSAMDLMGGEETRKGYNEGKNTDAFKRWLYGTDSKGQINYGKAAGEALDAATTLTNFIPGGGKLAANVAQGAVSGFANEYKEKGNDADLGNALKSAATGAVTGAVTSKMNDFVGKKMGELAEKQAANQLGVIGQKALNAGKSNFVRGAISGATGGAVGGGMATALNGGDLGQVLSNAISTAGSGGLQGGISGSVTGAIRNAKDLAVDKIRSAYVDGKLPIPQTDLTPNAGVKKRLESSFENGLTGDFEEGKNWVGRLKPDDVSTANNIQNTLGRQNINEDGNIYLDNYNAAEHAQKRFAENPQKNTPESLANTAYNAMFGDGKEILPNNSSNPNSVAFINRNNPSGMTPIGLKNGENEILSVIPQSKRKLNNFENTVENPEKGQAPDLLGAATGKISQNNQNINSKTSAAGQLRLKAAQALLDQYGTIDKPMARSANALENVQKVADAGFVKPADVENIINNITGANGKVTKLTQKLVSNAKPVDTSSDISKIIDEQIALNGLSGTSDEKAIRASIDAQLNRLPSRREGSITGLDQPEDVFDTIKALEKRSAELKGKSGNNYRLTTPERGDKAKVLDSITEVLKDRLYGGANIEGVLTPEVASELKNLAPKNEKWANYVDNTIMKSGDVGELRSTVAPFVNMGKVIDNQYMNYGTYGQRVGDAANEGRRIAGMISKTPVLGKLLGDIASSNVADRVRAKAYNYMADQVEARSNPTNLSTTISKQPKNPDNKITNLSSLLLGREVIPQTALNMIGRSVGNDNAYKVQNAMRANANDNMSDYNSQDLVGNNINHASQQSRIDSSPITEQLTKVGDAMQLALNAGDVASYSKLAGLYGDMMNIYKTQQAIFNPQAKATKLTDSQKKANVAMDLLNNLEGQQANVGSAVADIPILGGLMNIGGNEYKSSAEALESALGYLQSGAQISEKERESIRRAYIPQWGESEAVKKRKLAAARQVIQNFARANAED